MHPQTTFLTDDAVQRMRVLQRETNLGAGFNLARSDMQMRGSGNVFGEAQKGSNGVADIGVDMYVEVLQKTMRYLEQKRQMGLPDDDEMDGELLMEAIDQTMLMKMDDSLQVM